MKVSATVTPNSAEALFREGKLAEAINAQSAAVRSRPSDIALRWFLAELLCFAAEWERADRLLDVIAQQVTEALGGVMAFRHLIRGEEARRQVMAEGRAPHLIGPHGSELGTVVDALLCLREGKPAEAAQKLEAHEAAAVSPTGTRNGQAFEGFRDIDDVCSPLIEFITEGGEYHWVPIADLARLEVKPLERPRDLIWRPVTLEVCDGPKGEVFVPTVYVTDPPGGNELLRLGRGTDWIAAEGAPVRGVGLRSFLIGEEDVPIHELGSIVFTRPAAAATG